jgi:hypothetical protein
MPTPALGGAPAPMPAPARAAAPAPAAGAINPATGFEFGSKEDLELRMREAQKQQEVQKGVTEEENKIGNAVLSSIVQERPNTNALGVKIDTVLPNVKKFPTLFGSLSNPGIISGLGAALSESGDKRGGFFSSLIERAGLPKTNRDAAMQTLIAVGQVFDEAGALKGKAMFGGGQGETDRDLQKAMNMVGNPRLLNAKGVEASLKVMSDNIKFKHDMLDSFDDLKRNGSTMTFTEFMRSPEYKQAEKALRADYAESMKVINAANQAVTTQPKYGSRAAATQTQTPAPAGSLEARRNAARDRMNTPKGQ